MPQKPQQQNNPVVPPKKIIWMSCRAAEHCDGNQAYATLIFRKKFTEGGGRTTRYRCTKCNGVFTITA